MEPQNELKLPLEKQFTHQRFQEQIKTISLPEAKELLTELHFLYLAQQSTVADMAKSEFMALGAQAIADFKLKPKSRFRVPQSFVNFYYKVITFAQRVL